MLWRWIRLESGRRRSAITPPHPIVRRPHSASLGKGGPVWRGGRRGGRVRPPGLTRRGRVRADSFTPRESGRGAVNARSARAAGSAPWRSGPLHPRRPAARRPTTPPGAAIIPHNNHVRPDGGALICQDRY